MPTLAELKAQAKRNGIRGYSRMNKSQLMEIVTVEQAPVEKKEVPLDNLTNSALKQRARDLGIRGVANKNKSTLIDLIKNAPAPQSSENTETSTD